VSRGLLGYDALKEKLERGIKFVRTVHIHAWNTTAKGGCGNCHAKKRKNAVEGTAGKKKSQNVREREKDPTARSTWGKTSLFAGRGLVLRTPLSEEKAKERPGEGNKKERTKTVPRLNPRH